MNILVDYREPPHILKLGTVTQLPCGDAWLQCEDALIIVERKTTSDFLESIKDGRLFNQVSEMLKLSQWSYVAIEGVFQPYADGIIAGDQLRQWSFAAIEGAKLSIQELGCGVIHYMDSFDECLKQLAGRARGSVKIPPRREGYVFSPQEATLASLPGIGSKKAVEYLQLFKGNLALTLMALTGEHDIPGWGKKSQQNLVEFFTMPIEAKIMGD